MKEKRQRHHGTPTEVTKGGGELIGPDRQVMESPFTGGQKKPGVTGQLEMPLGSLTALKEESR